MAKPGSPPVITSANSVSVAENQIFAIDVDATDKGDTLVYAISGGADSDSFTIDATTGEVTFSSAPDWEAPTDADGNNVYELQVTVTDSGGLTATQTLSITVTNVANEGGGGNNAPTITSNAAVSVAENQTFAIDVQATDDNDSEGAGLTFAISGGADSGSFTIDAATGEITFNAAPDYETPADAGGNNVYELQVTVTDSGGLTATQNLSITVTDVNEGGGAGNTLAVLGLADSSDSGADSADDLTNVSTGLVIEGTYDISTNKVEVWINDSFAGNATLNGDGTWTLVTDLAEGTYTVKAGVTVGKGKNRSLEFSSDTATITVDTTAPTFSSAAAASVSENQTFAIDVDASDGLNGLVYSISGGADAGLFSIDSDTGVLSFVDAPNFEAPQDSGANNVYDIQVAATDAAGNSATQDIAVAVANVDEGGDNSAPVAADDGANATEDGSVVIDVLANDTDADGDTLTVSGVTQGANGTVVDNGDGTVTYTPDENFNGVDSFTYTISDGNGGTDTATVNVTVSAVNDAASFGGATDGSGAEDGGAITGTLTVSDPDGIAAQNFQIASGDGPANGAASINASGDWSYTPDANFNGGDSFTVSVIDDDGNTETQVISITVTAVNDDPVAVDDDATVAENDSVVIDVLANDSDLDGDALTVSGVTQGANGTVADNGDGTVTYTPNANFSGDDSFTYTVSDGNGGTATATVNVTVTAATPQPLITGYSVTAGNLINGDVTDDTTPTIEGTAAAGATVAVFVDGVPAGATTATGGVWSFTLGALGEGDYVITATADDGRGASDPSAPASLTIDTSGPTTPLIGSISEDTGYPAPNSDFVTSDASPDISGIGEAGSTVTIFIDDGTGPVALGTAVVGSGGDWTFIWTDADLADGDYTLTAQAEDILGRTSAVSAGRNLTIDATAPTKPAVVVVYDADGGAQQGGETDDPTPDIGGGADPFTTVEIWVDGALVGTETADASGTWVYEWDQPALADDSSHSVTVVSIDEAGNQSASDPFGFIVNPPTLAAPTITSWGEDTGIGDPSDPSRSDGVTNQNFITMSGTSVGDAQIDVYVAGVVVGTTMADSSGNWSFSSGELDPQYVSGSYDYYAVASIGNDYSVESAPATVTFDFGAPAGTTVTSASQADDSFTGNGQSDDTTPAIKGLAEADSQVDVYIDGAYFGTTTADAGGQWTLAWSGGAPLAEGTYSFTATATDRAGNVSALSGAYVLTIDTTPEPPAPIPDRFVPTDELYSTQWHFSMMGDIEKIWAEYTGDGVNVGVYDEGVQASHHDLDDNYNAALEVAGATPADGIHGTAVAGIIAAEADGTGTVGIAFEASLTGVNIISGAASANSADRTLFFAALDQMENFDVVNHSWGWGPGFGSGADQAERDDTVAFYAGAIPEFQDAVIFGRGGLGTILVKSGGNGLPVPLGEPISAQDDLLNSMRETIVVGATTEDGVVPFYSARGANLLVSAPSGGNWLSNDRNVQTTDLMDDIANPNDNEGYANGDYTGTGDSGFSGTSAAAPMVSGVVALMLEANPNLGWRDVQNILAYSAQHTGTEINKTPSALDGDERDVWQFNAADNWNGGGLHFSEDYGNGLVDAYAAVRMAEVWSLFGPALTSSNDWSGSASDSRVVPGGSGGISFSWNLTGYTDIELEYVEVTVTVADPSVYVDVISGAGTHASLYKISDDPGGLTTLSWTFGANTFRGEDITGWWYVNVGGTSAGTLIDVDITWFGVRDNVTEVGYSTADDVYHYTDEIFDDIIYTGSGYSAIVDDATRTTLSDGSGIDWLNMAAMTGDLDVDLASGATDVTRGISFLSIAGGTQIENAVTGDGDDTLTGTQFDNLLLGMRGDDSLFGLGGDDVLWGGAGSNLLDGGAGSDRFYFEDGFAVDTVQDWEAGLDTLDVSNFSEITVFSDFVGGASMVDGNLVFDAGGDSLNVIVFAGMTSGDFTEDDFYFGFASVG